ncbi:hypothetical protein [Cerasicoccus maritimus]|uniref:hypothetical protein n=1 Tax=Cerasicoccus maritimus TaxID=490089 RepID=UPI0028525BC1|nr:hypothetical protein [Cerasicoccus maritimus]
MEIKKTGRRESIDHREEGFFMAIEREDLNCPTLSRIWHSFYDGLSIWPNHSKLIIGELTTLDKFFHTNPKCEFMPQQWPTLRNRLSDFFRDAASTDSMIYTQSD